ncbi:peptidoglycan lytic protein P45 [hydrothermal vent metagenome]|uniref:Peptidoglycan lytic protein P45 n=1 Tax=hydrothermal vent metagenome TaxID=652676 RepID=A0A1W1CVM4_9ZZZZ
MKKITLTNLLLLTSVAFFTACSNKTPEVVKPKLTALDIMGIDVSTGLKCTPSIDNLPVARTSSIDELPLAQTYPVLEDDTPSVVRVTRQHQVRGCIIDIRRPRQSNSIVNTIEARAKELLGLKYVWGATGPNTYDCSGFTQKIYKEAGIKIPRVSRDQAKVGQYVSYNNLKKGDMVFFDTKKHPQGKVTHVGIYLGNGNFIHASSGAKKIVIFNFNQKSFYKKRFLWGRRVINDTTHLASL